MYYVYDNGTASQFNIILLIRWLRRYLYLCEKANSSKWDQPLTTAKIKF